MIFAFLNKKQQQKIVAFLNRKNKKLKIRQSLFFLTKKTKRNNKRILAFRNTKTKNSK